MLSREEVELYRRDGYLPGRRLLSAAEAERLRDDCLRTCAAPLVLGDQNPYSLKRHASNRVKPYLLFPWAAELRDAPRRRHRTASLRTRHAIALADRGLMALAGLWENWRSPAGE